MGRSRHLSLDAQGSRRLRLRRLDPAPGGRSLARRSRLTTLPRLSRAAATRRARTSFPLQLYFEFFSNALYTFTNGNSVAADTATVRYLAILNLTGANAGKIGFYSYKVNTGNTITVFNRLRSAAAGASLTTVGNVTWERGAMGGGRFR